MGGGYGLGYGRIGYSGLYSRGYGIGYGGYSRGYYGKREAEAEPFYGVNAGYGYSGYAGVHHAIATPAIHTAPVIHHPAAIAAPALAVASPAIAGAYAAPATSAAIAVRGYGTPATVGANIPYGYAASGHYRADSVGAVHIAKREAEADA